MTSPDRERELLDAVRRLPAPDRERYLRHHAPADDHTRRRVLELARALDDNPDFLATPVIESASVDALLGPRDRASDAPPPERIGAYRITRRIGAGGMGIVYEAVQDAPNRPVALKLLHATLTSERALRRFELEAEALGRLQHPGIAQIYEAGSIDTPEGSRPWFAMELVRGRPIHAHARQSNLSITQRLDLLARVCDAVHHAHQRGITHRDIKPANVLVDADSRPRVLDFGIAAFAGDDDHHARHALGTLGAAAPELCQGRRTDTRADVYSLGALAYTLLAGRPPHDLQGLSIDDARRRIAGDDPTPLGRIDKHLRGDIEAIVTQAMARDPDHRYQSASDLAADIRRHLHAQPVAARHGGATYHLRCAMRRHRGLTAGVLAALLFLLLGIATTGAGLAWALHERDESRAALADAEAALAALERALASPSPHILGRDVRATELLAEAEAAIESDFAGRPLLAARLRHTIGATYAALGELERAIPLLERALAGRRERLGPRHEQSLDSMLALGRALVDAGEYARAEPLLRDCLDARRERLGPHRRDTLDAMHALALLLDRTGRYDDAESLLIELRALAAEHHGPTDPLALTADNCIANIMTVRGNLEKSTKLHRATLDARARTLGDDHPDTLESRNNLAAALTAAGHHEPAAELLEVALDTSRRIRGRSHPDTLRNAANLAAVLRRLGRTERARALMLDTLRLRERSLGPHHPDTIISRANLAALYERAGDAAAAERLYGEAVASARRMFHVEHPTLGLLLVARARAQTALGRYEEAERGLLKGAEIVERAHGADSAQMASCARALVALYEAWGREEDAAKWRRE